MRFWPWIPDRALLIIATFRREVRDDDWEWCGVARLMTRHEPRRDGGFFMSAYLRLYCCAMQPSARSPISSPVASPTNSPLARIRELIATAEDARKRDSFARLLDKAIQSHLISRQTLEAHEADLGGVDDAAWLSLKAEAVQRLSRIRTRRRWDVLVDFLNEVKGYAYLKTLGCTEISFVARTYDRKSPDLTGMLAGRRVLCEVKTLMVSETPLSDDFLIGKLTLINKLTRTIAEAKAQLDEFGESDSKQGRDSKQGNDRKIIILVFRDGSRDGDPAPCAAQLDAFLGQDIVRDLAAGVEVTVFERAR